MTPVSSGHRRLASLTLCDPDAATLSDCLSEQGDEGSGPLEMAPATGQEP